VVSVVGIVVAALQLRHMYQRRQMGKVVFELA
jgi:hypothetical protein